jgi:hypothetical protein
VLFRLMIGDLEAPRARLLLMNSPLGRPIIEVWYLDGACWVPVVVLPLGCHGSGAVGEAQPFSLTLAVTVDMNFSCFAQYARSQVPTPGAFPTGSFPIRPDGIIVLTALTSQWEVSH